MNNQPKALPAARWAEASQNILGVIAHPDRIGLVNHDRVAGFEKWVGLISAR